MLNVFLAIAVDNLGNAQEMTARQEEEERIAQELKERCMRNEIGIFVADDQSKAEAEKVAKRNQIRGVKGAKQPVLTKGELKKKAAAKVKIQESSAVLKKVKPVAEVDVNKEVTKKVDLDYIPGLDTDDLQIVLPAEYEAPFKQYAKDKAKENKLDQEAIARQEKEASMKEAALLREEHIIIPPKPIPKPEVPKVEAPAPEETFGPTSPRPIIEHSCCFILHHENPIRQAVHEFVTYKYFDMFIMIVISASSVALATEDPIDENSRRNQILNYFDYGFTMVFSIEMTLKMIDLGIIAHEGSYFRDIWNCLDFIVVSCALFSFFFR